MLRYILIYGAIAGVILLVNLALVMAVGVHGGILGMVLGYLSMLVALSLVFVAIKRYRDLELGGYISFGKALGMGLAIAGFASMFYVFGWEGYLYATDYKFAEEFSKTYLEAQRNKGMAAAELAQLSAHLEEFKQSYAKPMSRMLMTFSEIAPVVVLMTLLSATILRKKPVS